MLSLVLSASLCVLPVFEHTGNQNMVTNDHKINTPLIVYVHGGITESSAGKFATDMYKAKETGQPVIPIVISSYGGEVHALLEMVDTIKNIGVPVATIITGKAMSSGIILASCGTAGMRYASSNSTIMIHEVSSGSIGKLKEIKADAKEAERLNKVIMEIMATNIGKSPDYFIDMIREKEHADWYMNVEEAKTHGLIDHIGTPQIKVSIDVNMTVQ